MTLIKSISGIRGTIGGAPGESLTPIDVVKFTYAYCEKMKERRPKADDERYKVVVGKDARLSGDMVEQLVCGTLVACGVDVVKAGFASTPTTEMAVVFEGADGGIILTASHNPKQWNALKLLNEKGEFLNAEEGAAILECAEREDFTFADVDSLGDIEERDFTDDHLDAVLALPEVQAERSSYGKSVVAASTGSHMYSCRQMSSSLTAFRSSGMLSGIPSRTARSTVMTCFE
jgi:phosphomannomutase